MNLSSTKVLEHVYIVLWHSPDHAGAFEIIRRALSQLQALSLNLAYVMPVLFDHVLGYLKQ